MNQICLWDQLEEYDVFCGWKGATFAELFFHLVNLEKNENPLLFTEGFNQTFKDTSIPKFILIKKHNQKLLFLNVETIEIEEINKHQIEGQY